MFVRNSQIDACPSFIASQWIVLVAVIQYSSTEEAYHKLLTLFSQLKPPILSTKQRKKK